MNSVLAQGFQDERELLGSEREEAIQQALGYFMVQHLKEIKELEQESFPWLREKLRERKRDRALSPGKTLLLWDNSQGEGIFLVFSDSDPSPGLVAQQSFLDPGLVGGGSFTFDSIQTNVLPEFTPGTGGGGGGSGGTTVILDGTTSVHLSSQATACGALTCSVDIQADGLHVTGTDVAVATIQVEGFLDLTVQGNPNSPFSSHCSESQSFATRVKCSTSAVGFENVPKKNCFIVGPLRLRAEGDSRHRFFDPSKGSGFTVSSDLDAQQVCL